MKLKMGYKLIAKNSRTSKQPFIGITANYIRFSPWFRDNNIIKRYVLFYANDDGFLCIKFLGDKTEGAYAITYRANAKTYYLSCPRPLLPLINEGHYDVTEKDGYYITDCKLNLKDNQ